MSTVKVRKLVGVEDGQVFVRAARKDGRDRYDANLQDLYLLEGRAALVTAAVRHYHGFVRTRTQ